MFHRTCLSCTLHRSWIYLPTVSRRVMCLSRALSRLTCQGSGSHFIRPSAVERIQQYLRCTQTSKSKWTFGTRLSGRNGKFRMSQNMLGKLHYHTVGRWAPTTVFWFWITFYRPPLLTNMIHLHKSTNIIRSRFWERIWSGYISSSIHD